MAYPESARSGISTPLELHLGTAATTDVQVTVSVPRAGVVVAVETVPAGGTSVVRVPRQYQVSRCVCVCVCVCLCGMAEWLIISSRL